MITGDVEKEENAPYIKMYTLLYILQYLKWIIKYIYIFIRQPLGKCVDVFQ